jgi:hypothetical protein
MIAVCNTSPISNLIQIQRLPLLFEQGAFAPSGNTRPFLT